MPRTKKITRRTPADAAELEHQRIRRKKALGRRAKSNTRGRVRGIKRRTAVRKKARQR